MSDLQHTAPKQELVFLLLFKLIVKLFSCPGLGAQSFGLAKCVRLHIKLDVRAIWAPEALVRLCD